MRMRYLWGSKTLCTYGCTGLQCPPSCQVLGDVVYLTHKYLQFPDISGKLKHMHNYVIVCWTVGVSSELSGHTTTGCAMANALLFYNMLVILCSCSSTQHKQFSRAQSLYAYMDKLTSTTTQVVTCNKEHHFKSHRHVLCVGVCIHTLSIHMVCSPSHSWLH